MKQSRYFRLEERNRGRIELDIGVKRKACRVRRGVYGIMEEEE